MKHDIRIENPQVRLVSKAALFQEIYDQYDGAVGGVSFPKCGEDEWGRLRIIIGEYVGNLYKHDRQVSFCDLEITAGPNTITVTLVHNGTDFDQLTLVPAICEAKKKLKITQIEVYGTGALHGFRVDVTI